MQSSIEEGGFDELDIQQIVIPGLHLDSSKSTITVQIEIFRKISRFLNLQSKNQLTFFPTLQQSGAIPLGLTGKNYPAPWAGIIMAPAAHLSSINVQSHHKQLEIFLQGVAYKRMVKQNHCVSLASLDPFFVRWIENEKVIYCPDPVELYDDYSTIGREFKQINQSEEITIVVVGTIDRRKQVARLAEIINSIDGNKYHLIVAGSVRPNALKEVNSETVLKMIEAGKATTILRRLSDEELDYLFYISDIVWSGNTRTYGSSGTIVRGALHSKPVISMDGSMMGNWLEEKDGGPVLNMKNNDAVREELIRLQQPEYRYNLGSKNNEIFRDNLPSNFAKTALEPLLKSDLPG